MDKQFYEFVYDTETIKSFYLETMSGDYALDTGEFWFLAASARNKELSTEERAELGISNHEMYASQISKGNTFEDYYKQVCKFECNVGAYIGKNGNPFPQKALGLYVTINPLSLRKAFLLKQEMDRKLIEVVFNSQDINDVGILNGMYKSIRMSNAMATKAVSKKHWIDMDIDLTPSFYSLYTTETERIDNILYRLGQSVSEFQEHSEKRKYIIIYTKGGIHFLVSTKELHKNPKILLDSIRRHFGEVSKEIEFVEGGVPLPGTLQRGHRVTYNVREWET